ncbi:MAG: AI-2E family transporter [Planctomycetes bacterium]|jgi:predicted PurR-regulated permease PerM|nr:AI-2E family transporter [Planctomycetota bacterium]
MDQAQTPETVRAHPRVSGVRFLVGAASFVIVVAGLQAARPIVIPILIAVFLAFVCVYPMRRLMRLGLPSWLAMPLVFIGLLAVLAGTSLLVGNSVASFTASSGYWNERIVDLVDRALSTSRSLGLRISREKLAGLLETDRILTFVSDTVAAVLSALSSFIVILVISIFLVLEAHGLPAKLRKIHGDGDALTGYVAVSDRIHGYLYLKAVTSLFTGALAAGLFAIFGVSFAVVLGLITFLFNFIPTIGSVIAGIPAVLLCLVEHGPGRALLLLAIYVGMNMLIGNVLEPRLMGRRLGLSPAVVLLSLIFWNWVLGPVGMLLSPPLTMMVKILMEQSADLRGAAILLGTPDEDPPAPDAPPG